MTLDQLIQVVQVSFPQVYLACHTRHQRKRTTEHNVSTRDAAILAHLDQAQATLPSRLAKHLSVSRSTVSEALKRLSALGYVARTAARGDRRAAGVVLTAKGAKVIRDTSVLETARLRAALLRTSRDERVAIVAGMTRLAEACRRLADGEAAA
jgi:DNA-binding MarR family transcriptional regulator